MRAASSYFDVLNAHSHLQTLQRLHAAAERARAGSQARYAAGDIAVTDMREAQADAVDVQELDARTAVALSEAAFTDLTGLDAAGLGPITAAATANLPVAESLEGWTQRTLRGSPQLAISRLALASAAAQVGRFSAINVPRLSLVAQTGRDSLNGTGDFGASDITQRQTSIGLQASIPLFTGGMRSAQRHEARALEHQAEAELDGATLHLRQQTRAAWLALTTAAAWVQALGHLRTSTVSRRNATRLGTEVGERTALELLSAEGDYQRAEADYSHAQAEWFLAGLQLNALTSEVGDADLQQIDRRLAAAPAPDAAPAAAQ